VEVGMNASALFVIGVGLTLAATLSVVAYLRAPLQAILVELCGSPQRAAFWAAFTNIVITFVPVVFAMQYEPEGAGSTPAILQLASQLKWGLVGLVVSVTVLAWLLSRFIPRAVLPTGTPSESR
jgi:hypothetical protein